MKKTISAIFIIVLCAMTTLTARAENFISDIKCNFRFGYMIGGTAPVGMPASIRSLDTYRLEPNITLGIDANKPISPNWMLVTGVRLENKGMYIDAKVKNYHMAVVKGEQRIEGYFTGGNVSKVEEWMFTVPFMLSYSVNNDFHIKGGFYLSLLTKTSFTGYAHDGYLREGDPTGGKIPLGNTEQDRGNYDFSDDMRKQQLGFIIGADYYWGRHWGAFVDLTWGATGIFKSSFKTIDQTLYPIYGSIGLAYRLK